jgi:hypothetical protein
MVNEFAPIIEKVLLIEPLIELIAVDIPTKAIIPIAIMRMVSIVLRGLDFIDNQEILMFSLKKAPASISV